MKGAWSLTAKVWPYISKLFLFLKYNFYYIVVLVTLLVEYYFNH
jgi:hypothetical protein